MSRQLVVWLALGTAGCFGAKDSDEDGLTDNEEIELGLDPESADTDGDGLNDGDEITNGADPLKPDTDGDGLNDGDEVANGADPTVVDTDGDGYTDRDEVHEEHDPADPNDVIYKGGWPYVFDKDSIKGGALEGNAEFGKRFARVVFKDQYGDDVDLFDFYNADKPVIIDISAQWCPPCQAMAMWIGGEEDYSGMSEVWPAGPEVVARGDVYWITILGEQDNGDPAVKKTATEWSNDFPSEVIPVLADPDYSAVNYVAIRGWPTLLLLEPDLKVASFNLDNYTVPLFELAERFPE
jgi:thiol-disulfide isomerase/thioredoxin